MIFKVFTWDTITINGANTLLLSRIHKFDREFKSLDHVIVPGLIIISRLKFGKFYHESPV